MTQTPVARTHALVELTGWDRNLARKVGSASWACSAYLLLLLLMGLVQVLAIEGSNILLDGAIGVDLGAAKDMIIMGFKQVCLEGPVCNETLHGVVFKITNAKLHPDSAHRRIDQILPMARSVFKGSVLAAQPALLEPIFQVDIQGVLACNPHHVRDPFTLLLAVPANGLTATRKVLKQRRGQIKEDNTNFDTGLHSVVAWLPVAESFGFSGDLVGATSGQAFPAAIFSHWEVSVKRIQVGLCLGSDITQLQVLSGDVLDPTAEAASLARTVRTRKRLKVVNLASTLSSRIQPHCFALLRKPCPRAPTTWIACEESYHLLAQPEPGWLSVLLNKQSDIIVGVSKAPHASFVSDSA